MKKILLVFGTRPEAIKMAPLVMEFKKFPNTFETIVCVTGQHREMLYQVLNLFEITPDYDLNIMKQGQDLYDITSRIILGMRDVIKDVNPDIVLVHGDTTTSMASSIAAFYQQIPVGHVEAGLRTNNIHSPWPEEVNRQITARIADVHFAPTLLSKENLIKENISERKITITGNTVIDTLHFIVEKLKNNESLEMHQRNILSDYGYNIERLNDGKKLILITGHRRENFGSGFINICKSIHTLSEKFSNVDFIYPMHLNPNVRKPITQIFGSSKPENVFFCEPLEYLTFIYLMSKSYIILTDSGGIQEEAPGLGIPVLVMRDTTERPEAVNAGTVRLVGTSYDTIITETSKLLNDGMEYLKMSKSINPYGDGMASKRIVEYFMETL